ncbi:hypothetical protein PLIIFM63780_002741 [Purpureocillium lilacinum]|nr:hypothetical protein PLIIFM63780_002741 [Purpureocillium lilacinum]
MDFLWASGETHIGTGVESQFHYSPRVHDRYPGSKVVTCLDAGTSNQSDTARYNCVPTDSSSIASLTSQTPSSTPANSHLEDSCADFSGLDGLTLTAREFLATEMELEYMKAFVDGIGAWMDSLGEHKFFSQVVPYHALESPALLNALLACGAKHLSFGADRSAGVNPDPEPELLGNTAAWYYNAATMMLVRQLQNRDCDVAECAVTSLVLHVYEVMAGQHLSHGAGARLLIRNLEWDARSRAGKDKSKGKGKGKDGGEGVGAACFWLSVGMEVLQCLEHKWVLTWDPDEWGLESEWAMADGSDDMEAGQELWMHRALYVVAKVVNFRATSSLYIDTDPHDQQARLRSELAVWQDLKRLCDRWNDLCPRSMRPVAYLPLGAAKQESSFPRFWLTRDSATLGRLFYHTAQCILTQMKPLQPPSLTREMMALQHHHARQVLGIVASNRERKVIPMVMQAIVVASMALVDRAEQLEALSILQSIPGRGVGYMREVEQKLKHAWRWPLADSFAGVRGADAYSDRGGEATKHATQWQRPTMRSPRDKGIHTVNPLSSARIDHPQRPYKTWYRAAGG